MEKVLPFLGFSLFFLALDVYSWQAFRSLQITSPGIRHVLTILFWGLSAFFLGTMTYFWAGGHAHMSRTLLFLSFSLFFVVYVPKLILCLFMLAEDGGRLVHLGWQWARNLMGTGAVPHSPARSAALAKIAFSVAALPFFSLLYGIVKGGHRYQIRPVRLTLPNLPEAFRGLKIVQISDIHAGSFYDSSAVARGIDLVMEQKPDVVFFTGDLVNDEAREIESYLSLFSRIQAPMGVFSILGNHDYGDYRRWGSPEEKVQNFSNLIASHARMGWRLLMDEHVALEKDGSEIAVVGVQNWSARGRFPKIGNLRKAMKGTGRFPVCLLLSHDPSHWDAEVFPRFPRIDAMFAGHTHGMQFGVEVPGFRWSPVQYVYRQWAGLYSSGHRHLYVNRGFGFIAYPGRVGIWPEITVFTLDKA